MRTLLITVSLALLSACSTSAPPPDMLRSAVDVQRDVDAWTIQQAGNPTIEDQRVARNKAIK